ncbi:hypothetical protein DSO57_1005996 [Entomophthora muscae]|uniref:Uncharacterized protein n=1 Tax=Entomophthora muscae TaxID=34485 RepID=A0ACC2SKF0_9FUNG|nr:hypothetical protein DSO57_1005996 [Entomophthora muscae]
MYKFPEKYIPVKKDIIHFLETNTDYEDGSYGPLFVRLAWHASGTFVNGHNIPGGICTGLLSIANNDPANAGLHIAVEKLKPIYEKHNWITHSDLYTLAGAVAVEKLGGPVIPWKPGRTDIKDKNLCPAHGRLPDASQGSQHVKEVFCEAMRFFYSRNSCPCGVPCSWSLSHRPLRVRRKMGAQPHQVLKPILYSAYSAEVEKAQVGWP